MKILLPINIDRWRSPIATLLRACVEFNPDIQFVSYSSPQTTEDKIKSEQFWRLPNVSIGSPVSVLTQRFDLVHIASHTYKNLTAGTIAKIRGINHTRFLYTINLELMQHSENNSIYKWFNAVVDDYVAVSQAASSMVRRICPELFHGVIPNGYDPDYFDPSIEVEDDLPEKVLELKGKPYVLNVASLEKRKHPEWIVRLAQENPDLNFVMVGWVVPGVGATFLNAIVSSALPNLIWLGHVERKVIRALLRYASVFAFPSEREGLPLSVIEAMGMGVPVVAQPKSSLPELIVDSECGSLIDIDQDGSLHLWSEALRDYVAMNDVQRSVFSSALAERTKSLYSWESIGLKYSIIYKDIILCE